MEQITLFLFIRLVRILVGIISFIGLLSLDVWKAWKSKAHWVPQGALVLSAFSLQLLALLDTDAVSISDYPDYQEYDLKRVLQNGLLIDGGRVMVCVYMAYLLPEMAVSTPQSVVWNDIGALALSVFTHIFSELYAFIELHWNLKDENFPVNPLSIASRVCTMVCATLLFLLLGSAAFAGKTIYNLVLEKIPLALKEKPEPENYEDLEAVEKDVLLSWVVTWVCRPDYVIARSVLASSVGLMVTLSFGCFAAEWIFQDYKVLRWDDGIDWFRYTVTAFMTLMVLIGWSTIFWRWMFAIFHFPGKYKIPNKGYFQVEDFWIRHIFEVMDDIQFPRPSWNEQVSGGGFLENLKLRVLRALKVPDLLRGPLLYLQRCVICFSKFCCFWSETILFVNKTRSLIVGVVDPDFLDFQEALKKVVMPGETEETLIAASKRAIKQIKDFMEKGRKDGENSNKLIQLLNRGSTDAGRYFVDDLGERLKENALFDYLGKFSWKMTALSLIQVIIALDGHQGNDALDAYSQAYDFLDLLDNPAGYDAMFRSKFFTSQLFVRAADKQFMIMKKDQTRPPNATVGSTMQEALENVTALRTKATTAISRNPNDSVDWWEVSVNHSLDKVCGMIIGNCSSSETTPETTPYTDVINRVWRLLADMLALALKKVGKDLVDNCRGWAETLEEEKIRASVYVAGKLSGVTGNLDVVRA